MKAVLMVPMMMKALLALSVNRNVARRAVKCLAFQNRYILMAALPPLSSPLEARGAVCLLLLARIADCSLVQPYSR